MNQDKLMPLVEKNHKTFVAMAHSQAELAIGQAVVQMHLQGLDINKAALIANLVSRADGATTSLEREKFAHAARLLGAAATTPD